MRKVLFILAAAALLAAAAASYAGNIPGRLVDSRDVPRSHIYTCVTMNGSSMTGNGITATDWEGIFYWSGLPAGTYSQAFSEKEHFNVYYRKGISVPSSGDALWNVLRYRPTTFSNGTEWYYTWHTWYAQSFKATGNNLISIGLRMAGPASGNVMVTIHNGDNPSAAQIGPSRTLNISTTNGQAAYWSAGEVPTTIGQTYTVKFTLAGGGQFSPWRQTVYEWGSCGNPDGKTWVDGVETNEPLEMTVNMDDAGFSNTMCCARGESGVWFNNDVGQTFTAKGSSLLMVTWLTGTDRLWEVSVHNGGPGGTQVGVSKYVRGVAWNGRSVVCWAPGEVPTTPGQTYYVRLKPTTPPPSGVDQIYNVNSNQYSGGQAYRDGVAQSYDWAMGIYEEKFTGAIDQPLILTTSVTVDTVTSNSAIVRWTTVADAYPSYTVASDSMVEYGEGRAYTHSVYNTTLTPHHSMTLTGLKPNTVYHVRVNSKASGYKAGRSGDVVFVTAPDTANLLADPGFESGEFGAWTGYGGAGFRTVGWYYGSGPRTGTYGVGNATSGGAIQSGVYQRRAAVPGQEYRFSAWVYTYSNNINATKNYQAVTHIGIDPYGGTDAASANVIWTPYTHAQQKWTCLGVSAIAKASTITVFLHGGNDVNTEWCVFTFDDAVLTGPIPPAVSMSQVLANRPDGEMVTITGKCIANATQAGHHYVEAVDRSCGIRVRTNDILNVGELATITGTLATRGTGERQLNSAMVMSRTPSTAIKPLYARANAIGGSSPGPECAGVPGTVGLYNVGMLMRVSGRVTAIETGYIYINDGSLPGNGLKVNTGAVTTPIVVGKRVAVTGAVRLENTTSGVQAVIRARDNTDVWIY